jgi:hypothetical protein
MLRNVSLRIMGILSRSVMTRNNCSTLGEGELVMTERQRTQNRKRHAARLVRTDREVEAFKKAAKIVPTRRRYGDEDYDATEYANLATDGLVLRVEVTKPECRSKDFWGRDIPDQRPQLRWLYKRHGRRELELCVHGGTPTSAREDTRLLRAGDESTIMCAYLQNDGGGECHYHNDFDLLQELTLDQLKERIARKKRMLKLCVRYPRENSLDYVWPLRREIRELEKTLRRYTGWIEREGLKIHKPRPRVVAERARSRRAA